MARRAPILVFLFFSVAASLHAAGTGRPGSSTNTPGSPGSPGPAPSASAVPDASGRLPVPTSTQQSAAASRIRDLYRADFAKKSAADQLALAQRLFLDAGATGDDSMRYALLHEAIDLAQRNNDAILAVDAIDAMARRFRVLEVSLKTNALNTICLNVEDTQQGLRFLRAVLLFLEPLVRADAFDRAEPLLTRSEQLARSLGPGGEAAQDAARTLSAWHNTEREFIWARAALARIKTNPEDTAAQLIAGRYQCLVKEDWDAGTISLARSSDLMLRLAAQSDQAATHLVAAAHAPVDRSNQAPSAAAVAKAQVQAADNWFELAAQQPEPHRPAMIRRALYWYRAALGQLQLDANELSRVMHRLDLCQDMLRRRPASLAKLSDDEFDRVIAFRDKFFLLASQRQTIAAATAWAHQRGATLACIADDDENLFIQDLMHEHGLSRLWLGGNYDAKSGKWSWLDGALMGYTHWAANEPTKGKPHMQAAADGRWYTATDRPCACLVQWTPSATGTAGAGLTAGTQPHQ